MTTAALLALIEKGNAADAARLDEIRQLAAQYKDVSTFARHLIARHLLTKWQIQQMQRGVWQLSIGKYRLREERGIGRIGRELTAEHISLGRKVVLKLVSRILTNNPKRLEQFLQDFRKVAAIDHPNLVHSFDVDSEGQRYFVVTEYVHGENLEQRVRREDPLTIEQALPLLTQAARGLAFAASQGLVHCDLKPSNLVVDERGNLKVTDLGYGRLIDGSEVQVEKAREAHDKAFNTGIEYRAPELGDNHREINDPRVDFYSFGQTLFFLLTGAVPDTEVSEFAARSAPFLERVPGATPELADFYAQLTSPEAAERPASWDAILASLAALLPDHAAAADAAASDLPSQNGSKETPLFAPSNEVRDTDESEAANTEPESMFNFTAPAKNGKGAAAKTASLPASPEKPKSAATPAAATPAAAKQPASPKNGGRGNKPLPQAKATAPPEPVDDASDQAALAEEESFTLSDDVEQAEEGVEAILDEPTFQFNFASKPATTKTPAVSVSSSAGKQKATAKTKTNTKNAADANDAAASPARGRKKGLAQLDPKWLLIGGGAVVLVLLITIGVLVTILISGGSGRGEQVAQQSAGTEPAKPTDAAATTPSTPAPAAKTTEKSAAPNPSDKAVAPAPAGTDSPENKQANPSATDSAPVATDPPEVKTEGGEVPAASENKTPPAEAVNKGPIIEVLPNSPETSPPAKTPPPSPEAKPADKTAPAAKTPPAKTAPPTKAAPPPDPLAGLTNLFALPELEPGKAFDIGACVLNGKICVIELAGGEIAYKGRQSFGLNAVSATSWDVTLSGKPGESESVVAKLNIEQDKLQFVWTPAAAEQATVVPYLKNCLLRVSVGPSQRQIRLREPASAPAAKISLDKPAPIKFALEHLPDTKNIRVEVLATPAIGFPNARPLPDKEFSPGETSTVVWVGPKEGESAVGLKIDGKASVRGLDITYVARAKPSPNDNADVPLVKARFTKDRKVALERLAIMENQKKLRIDAANKEGGDAKAKKERTDKIEAEYKLAVQDPIDQLNRIQAMIEELEKAELHVRVAIDVGSGYDKVILAETAGAPQPPPPAPKK
jgi:serine/threonine protein kinase/phage-related protein